MSETPAELLARYKKCQSNTEQNDFRRHEIAKLTDLMMDQGDRAVCHALASLSTSPVWQYLSNRSQVKMGKIGKEVLFAVPGSPEDMKARVEGAFHVRLPGLVEEALFELQKPYQEQAKARLEELLRLGQDEKRRGEQRL